MSGIYIHWPYCISKCYYCDFYSVNYKKNVKLVSLYINVLREFLNTFYQKEKITSIYFGGGTPSLASLSFFSCILEFIFNNFYIDKDIEITLEVNPKTINLNKAKSLKKIGINRLSIGVQSIFDYELKILGRIHTSLDALCCIYDMASIFDNVSIDIIYNRPGQTLKNWQLELNKILNLPIQHISLYELTVEKNTYMQYLINQGILSAPLVTPVFFNKTVNIMKDHGWEMYEVSNFTKNHNYSKHNLSYWTYDNYYGIGASSHSRVVRNDQKYAIEQIADINKWIQWAKYPKFHTNLHLKSSNESNHVSKTENPMADNNIDLVKIEKLSKEKQDIERLLMGLRTKFGVKINTLSREFIDKYNIAKKLKILQLNNYAYSNRYVNGNDKIGFYNKFLCNYSNAYLLKNTINTQWLFGYRKNGTSHINRNKQHYKYKTCFNNRKTCFNKKILLYDLSMTNIIHSFALFAFPNVNKTEISYRTYTLQYSQYGSAPNFLLLSSNCKTTFGIYNFQIISGIYSIEYTVFPLNYNNSWKNDILRYNFNYKYNNFIKNTLKSEVNCNVKYSTTNYDDEIILTVNGIMRLNLILKYLIQN